MKNEIESRSTRSMMPANAAPRGVAIMGAYLIGMAAIGAGAYVMRDRVTETPVKPAEVAVWTNPIAVTMLPPAAGNADSPAIARAGIPSTMSIRSEVPRLAVLTPTDTRLEDDLFSPVSRIFLGKPSAVPPVRPVPESESQTAQAAQPEAVQPEAAAPGGLRVSLRPRIRPSGIRSQLRLADGRPGPDNKTGAASDQPRIASRSQPQDLVRASRAEAALPPAPRVADVSASCPRRLARAVPRRSRNAPEGRAFMSTLEGLDGVKRDRLVAAEILKGDVPGFLRNLVPVSITSRSATGAPTTITLCVTPDYLALGSNRDFVRVPLGLRAATRIGDAFNMILPTPRMVDLIYRAADLRLSPRPMPAGPQMTSTAYLLRHNQTIRAQRESAGTPLGTLIAGQKKDVVLSNRLASHRGRVAIYGWHRSNGRPIQPLSTVHGAGYADYSHGIRLVSRTAFLDGKPVDLRSLMADSRYAGLLSKEGPVGDPRLRMAALAAN